MPRLCSDTWRAFGVVAAKHGLRHEPIDLFAGERGRERTWHIQNANARHSRLEARIAGFRGVATRSLPNSLAWHPVVDRRHAPLDHAAWLRLAVNSQREHSQPKMGSPPDSGLSRRAMHNQPQRRVRAKTMAGQAGLETV